jgi:acetyl esterase/lipase
MMLQPRFGPRWLVRIAILWWPILGPVLAAGAEPGAVWVPPDDRLQLPLWPDRPPGDVPSGPETVTLETERAVAGRPWQNIRNVSVPTLTRFEPVGANTGAAVVVFPGGGYETLAIDLEGTEVCEWFAARGIICFVIKYRVPAPRSWPSMGAYPQSAMALQDAQRAIRLVRANAAEWRVDPHRIGVVGFSAGGHLVAAVSVHFRDRLYAPVDAADRESPRPDFAIALYPGHLVWSAKGLGLNPDIAKRVSAEVPPTFLLQNEDDDVDDVEDALSYFVALKRAGVPAELHVYPKGGHAFGLRRQDIAAKAWPEMAEQWLRRQGMLPADGENP